MVWNGGGQNDVFSWITGHEGCGKNNNRYKHTVEKIKLADKHVVKKDNMRILETHAGFGNMTSYWLSIGDTTSIEIKKGRCEEIDKRAHVINADCHNEVYKLIADKNKYDILDIDPYGLPSRLFPHVLELINDGIMFLTFPKYGATQLNKISIAHYKILWDIDSNDGILKKIQNKLDEYGFHQKKTGS